MDKGKNARRVVDVRTLNMVHTRYWGLGIKTFTDLSLLAAFSVMQVRFLQFLAGLHHGDLPG